MNPAVTISRTFTNGQFSIHETASAPVAQDFLDLDEEAAAIACAEVAEKLFAVLPMIANKRNDPPQHNRFEFSPN